MSQIYAYAGFDPCDEYDEYILNNPPLATDCANNVSLADCVADDDYVVMCQRFINLCSANAILTMLNKEAPNQKTDDLLKLFTKDTVADLTLAYRLQNHNTIYCRMGAKPLVIGISQKGNFLADSVKALQPVADKYIALKPGEKAKITKDKITVFNKKGVKIKKSAKIIDKERHFDYDYCPADEIFCCQNAVKTAINALCTDGKINLDHLKISKRHADKINHVVLIGEGASHNACLGAKYVFELLCNVTTTAMSSTEFIHSSKIVDKNTLLVALSQTGETTSTIWGADYAIKNSAKVVALTADVSSHLGRTCDFVINTDCQLSSTSQSLKSFINSYLCLCILALYIGQKRGIVSDLYANVSIKMAQLLCGKIVESTKPSHATDMLAYMINEADSLVFTGCGVDYCACLEARAKLWHVAGISADCITTDMLPHTDTSGKTILAIISNKDYLHHSAKILQKAQNQGAKVIIVTTSNIEADLDGFEKIVAFGDSVPIFNILPITAGLYKTAVFSNDSAKSFC